MAFKLTKQEDARKSELEQELETLVGVVEDEKAELEAAMQKLIDDFNETVVAPLREKMQEAYGFVEDIVNERQGEFDDKSERWQEGDRGQAAQDWLQTWERSLIDLEAPLDAESPTFEFEVPDANNALCELPIEMEA